MADIEVMKKKKQGLVTPILGGTCPCFFDMPAICADDYVYRNENKQRNPC